jgi:hypothetical protein
VAQLHRRVLQHQKSGIPQATPATQGTSACGPARPSQVRGPLRHFVRAALAGISLCDVCSCHEILRAPRPGSGQQHAGRRAYVLGPLVLAGQPPHGAMITIDGRMCVECSHCSILALPARAYTYIHTCMDVSMWYRDAEGGLLQICD